MESEMGHAYERQVAPARRLLESDPSILELLDERIDTAVLERFLIQFSAMGVQMTQPVDGWIRRAGERTIALGLQEIGRSLVRHSRHEVGHHLMLIEDTRLLVSRWNDRRKPLLSLAELLEQAPTTAMQEYLRLHEDTIASEMPYGQVAIELEIERMSTTFGPKLMKQCHRVLDPSLLAGLSFIREHVEVDVGHTALNEKMMDRLLRLRPDAAARFAAIGSEALRIYVSFFGECLRVSQN